MSPKRTRISWRLLWGEDTNIPPTSHEWDTTRMLTFLQEIHSTFDQNISASSFYPLYLCYNLTYRKGLGGGESPEHDGGDFQLDADMSPRCKPWNNNTYSEHHDLHNVFYLDKLLFFLVGKSMILQINVQNKHRTRMWISIMKKSHIKLFDMRIYYEKIFNDNDIAVLWEMTTILSTTSTP